MLLTKGEAKERVTVGNTIYASFADADLAEKAAGALLDHGVHAEDLSVVRGNGDPGAESTEPTYVSTGQSETWPGSGPDPDADRMTYSGSVYGTTAAEMNLSDAGAGSDPERAAKEGISTTTGADAAAGAAKGAGWGLGIGVVAGVASLIVPGVGVVIGGGALATALAGLIATTAGGMAAGAVTGYLKDQGMDEHLIADYDRTLSRGGAMIAVTVPSGDLSEYTVQEILSKYGATRVNKYASRGYVA